LDDLELIRDRHRGETVVVAGCGPSLASFDFAQFRGIAVLGSNSIGQLAAPTYYAIFDPFVFSILRELFYATPSIRILPPWIDGSCDYRIGYRTEDEIGFGTSRLFSGRTAGFLCLGLAAVMGATEIHVIGIDGYDRKVLHGTQLPPEYSARARVKWTDARRSLVYAAWRSAAEWCTDNNVRLVNNSTDAFLYTIPGIFHQYPEGG
jgi:hypothetical protein